jgi:putative chitinase
MITIDSTLLKEIAPHIGGKKGQSQAAIIAAVGEVATATLDKYEINTRLRIAHFLAQTCHESDGFCTTVEYASGDEYEGPRDLGNVNPGDGRRYKGRGLIQLTGRANYKTYGDALGIDLVNAPQKAAEPATSLLVACEYWNNRKLSGFADKDDLITITKKINGGLNGLDSRRAYLVKAKQALVRLEAVAASGTDPQAAPALRRGSKGEAVAALQEKLQAAGYPLAIDGDYGAATELAISHFQTDHNLTADGIAGEETLKALDRSGT